MKSEPVCLKNYESGLLQEKVQQALKLLESCTVCPRDCKINRLQDEYAVCRTSRYALVSSYSPHFGEENCLRGWKGSGTIFFENCNLKCVFCQNYDISQQGRGRGVQPEKLAQMMLDLQAEGCHNINFVTPEHVVPQILEALLLAVGNGLHLPIVYNTSAYDSMDSMNLLDGVVDIYMPDFKFWDIQKAKRYLKAEDYPETAKGIIIEMHRQVGDLIIDEHGVAQQGVLLRHLVMPGDLEGTRSIMRWIANELSPNTYVNVMSQYRPAYKAVRYPEINRPMNSTEFRQAIKIAEEEGVERLDHRTVAFF